MIKKIISKRNKKFLNIIKIIGGKWRSRLISISKKNFVRPTISRIKTILFDWLKNKIIRAKCLDCFSGSGSLGIESLSRNAKTVTFVDNNHIVIRNLFMNLNSLKAKNFFLVKMNILKWLKKSNEKFDIVFIDPPFNKNLFNKVFFLLEKKNKLNKNSYIYIECFKNEKYINIPKNWILRNQLFTNKVSYSLYKKN